MLELQLTLKLDKKNLGRYHNLENFTHFGQGFDPVQDLKKLSIMF